MVEPSQAGKSVITGSRSGGLLCPLSRPTAPPRRHLRSARVRRIVPETPPRRPSRPGSARERAAPRIEDAAAAVETTVAPKVSSALRSTAEQVRPNGSKTGVRRLLSWRWMLGVGAALAAAGAGAAVAMRRRYASATAEAKNATELAEEDRPAQDGEQASNVASRSDVNGRVI